MAHVPRPYPGPQWGPRWQWDAMSEVPDWEYHSNIKSAIFADPKIKAPTTWSEDHDGCVMPDAWNAVDPQHSVYCEVSLQRNFFDADAPHGSRDRRECEDLAYKLLRSLHPEDLD